MQFLLKGSNKAPSRLLSTHLPYPVAALAVLTTIIAFFFGTISLPVLQAFIPSIMTAVAFSYLLTSVHLFLLYILSGRQRLAILGATFTLSGLLVIVYLLTFPQVIPLSGFLAPLATSATWFWLLWHIVFPLGIVVSLLVPDQEHPVDLAIVRYRHKSVLVAVALLIFLTLLVVGFILIVSPHFPLLVVSDHYTQVHVGLQILLLILDGFALALALIRRREGTMLDLWLIVCLLITLCDAQINLSSQGFYDLGWYLSLSLSLVAASLLLFALLDDFSRIYGNLALAHDALSREGERDFLTRVGSRKYTLACASKLLAAQTPFCLSILDLDHFKSINDTYGHLAGDDVLSAIASRILNVIKAEDLVGRLGGEEFVLLYINLPLPQAMAVSERVLATIRSTPISTRIGAISLTASLGLALARSGETLDHLLSRADAALYEAKNDGRDRVDVAN